MERMEPDMIDVFYHYAIVIAICSRARPLDAFIDVICLVSAYFLTRVGYIVYLHYLERLEEL